MKVTYKSLDGTSGHMSYEAIVPQPMTHVDGFTLLGFESWEDVTDEKLAWAATNVAEFQIDKQKSKVGFHGQDQG